ncbi:hypothetical protein CR969_02575 [Candidatus Saccharibacteria bacterium]|nr:MAG: hypothetical protein CR969_02575 [Candidatus Saccharibacteria bacterium]
MGDNKDNQEQAPTNPPVQPTQPVPPVQPVQPVAAPSLAPKKSKLGVIIGGSVALVLLIVGIILAVLFLSGPSQRDYKQAADKYEEIGQKLMSVGTKSSSVYYGFSSSTETSFKNDIEDIKESLEKIKKYNKELGEMKAVKKGPAKEPYDKFNDKFDKFVTYVEEFSDSMVAAKEGFSGCDRAMNGSSSVTIKAINDCVADMGSAEDKVKNKTLKEFISKFKSEMKLMSDLYAKAKAIKNPYGRDYDKYRALKEQLYEVQGRLRDAAQDMRSDIEKDMKKLDPRDEAKELSKILRENSR